jgi:hypothetical protein
MNEFALIYNVDNSGILASLLSLDGPTRQLLWISALYQNVVLWKSMVPQAFHSDQCLDPQALGVA